MPANQQPPAPAQPVPPTPQEIAQRQAHNLQKAAQFLSEGLAAHKGGNLAAAETSYRDALFFGVGKHQAQALYLLGILLYSQGKCREALPLIDASLKADPSSAQAHAARANILHVFGRRAQALAACEAALAITPALLEMLCLQGRLHTLSGNLSGAEISLLMAQQACEAAGQPQPYVHYLLGLLHIAKGNIAEGGPAHTLFNGLMEASASNPNPSTNPLGHAGEGQRLLATGNLEAAEAALRKALDIEEANPEWHAAIGDVFAAQSKHEWAFGAYQTATKKEADRTEFHLKAARAALTIGKHNPAYVHAKHAFILAPARADVCLTYGEACLSVDDKPWAIGALQQALALQPENSQAAELLAKAKAA